MFHASVNIIQGTKMEMDLIRKAFSKGATSFSKTVIRVIYNFRGGWFNQYLNDEEELLKSCLLNLLHESDRVCIDKVQDKAIRISFYGEYDIGQPGVYPPLKKDFTSEEISQMMKDIMDGNDSAFELAKELTIEDMAILDVIMTDWLKQFRAAYHTDQIQLIAAKKMPTMVKLAEKFARNMWLEIETTEPVESFGGSVEVTVLEKNQKPLWFLADQMTALGFLIELSSGFEMEGNVEKGEFKLRFYA